MNWQKAVSIAAGVTMVASAAFSSAASAQGDARDMLQPSSPWNLDYADDSCRLFRLFGEGENETVLIMDSFAPGGQFQLTVAGGSLRKFVRAGRDHGRWTAEGPLLELRKQFGPQGEKSDQLTAMVGVFDKFEPAIIIPTTSIASPTDVLNNELADDIADREPSEEWRRLDEALSKKVDAAIAEREAQAEWLLIESRGRPVYFATGSMKAPRDAVQKCMEDLITSWGVDLEAQRSFARPALPIGNPGQWVKSNDYPDDLLRGGALGIVRFRLEVDTGGKPTTCHTQGSTRPEGFDEAACRALMQNARFEPALDADGNPAIGVYFGTVIFR